MEKIWYKNYPKGIDKEINPDRYKSIVDFFEKKSRKFSDLKAVTNMGVSLTYNELERKSRHFASYLQNTLNLGKGDRLAIMLPNCLQYYVSLFGALRAGLTVVNVNPLYNPRELRHQLRDSEVESIVVMANFAHTLEKALPDTMIKNIMVTQLGDLFEFPKAQIINFVVKYIKRMVPNYSLPNAIDFKKALAKGSNKIFNRVNLISSDIAFLQYTGGTTGVAKGAILTHGNIVANVAQIIEWCKIASKNEREVTIAPLPLYHIFSLTACCFTMIGLGAETVLITNPRDFKALIKELKSIKFTLIFSVNTLCYALLQQEEFEHLDFSRLKVTITGGMSTSQSVAERWKKVTGVGITEGYGLTETSPVVCMNIPVEASYSGGIGYPLPSTEVEIRDGEGNSLPVGKIGELYVRGPQVMSGYWNMPEETALIMTEDGWLKTGDMVTINDKGLVKVVDRKKDMILVSGFNVYPTEVEEVLTSHPQIIEAAVIGIDNPEHTGEAVKAVIVSKSPELTSDDVIEFCRKNLTAYKIPHNIEFRDELPKSPVGKILRRILRDETD